MLKNVIDYQPANETQFQVELVNNINHQEYLKSVFIDESCNYFWSNTSFRILNKDFQQGSSINTRLKLRFDNKSTLIEEYYSRFDGEPCIYFPEGLKIIEVKMPITMLDFNKWTPIIKRIGIQLYWLNPHISKEFLSYYLYKTALTYVKIPRNEQFIDYRLKRIKGRIGESISFYSLYSKEIISKIDEISNQILSIPYETIKPKLNGKVYFLNNPDYDLSDKDIKECQNKIQGQHKSNQSSLKIEELILNWDFEKHGLIKKNKIASILGISISTVTRRWKPFVDRVRILNNNDLGLVA